MNFTSSGAVQPQSGVRAIFVVVFYIFQKQSSQMLFGERNDVIREFTANRTNPAFCNSVLPRTHDSREVGAYVHDLAKPILCRTKDRIIVRDEDSGNVIRKCGTKLIFTGDFKSRLCEYTPG
jgi:hypothetical protein